MKKLFIVPAILLLCACTSLNKPDDPEIIEPEPFPETGNPIEIGDDIIAYLDGTWSLYAKDSQIELEIDGNGWKAIVKDLDNDAYIKFNLWPFESYEGIEDAIRFDAYETSDYYTSTYGSNMAMFSSFMQYMTATYQGKDYLFLRELGNGFSVLDGDALGDTNMVTDYGWLFTRERNNSFPGIEENDTLKFKNGDYYCFAWLRGSDSYLLQQVDIVENEETWYEDPIETIRIVKTENEFYNICFLYNSETLPDSVNPGLVKVKIDENGFVTEIEDVEYLGYGAYRRKKYGI